MRSRCGNDKDYLNVKVCKRWDCFWTWLDDMGEPPSPIHQIDRIKSDGDYKPSNCRWVLPSKNAYNRKRFSNNTSGRKGVVKGKDGFYVARITIKGERIVLVRTRDIKVATEYRERAEKLYPDVEKIKAIQNKVRASSTTGFTYISLTGDPKNKYAAKVKNKYLGRFKTIEEAIRARDTYTNEL